MDDEQDVAPSLSSFLSAWRRELASRERNRLLGEDEEEGAEWEERVPEPEQSVKRAEKPREPSPLLVLPPVRGPEPSGGESVGNGEERAEVSLVDTLIADLVSRWGWRRWLFLAYVVSSVRVIASLSMVG